MRFRANGTGQEFANKEAANDDSVETTQWR